MSEEQADKPPREPMTLGDHWRDHFFAGMNCVRILLNRAADWTLRAPVSREGLVELLNQLVAGKYQADDFFGTGQPPRWMLLPTPPEVQDHTRYAMLALNAETALSKQLSGVAGGLVFEDPFWAVMAAYLAGKRGGERWALPKAEDNAALWKNVPAVEQAAEKDTFKPDRFFATVEGPLPPAEGLQFSWISVSSSQIVPLRTRGMQSLQVAIPPRHFQLFTRA